VLVDCSGDGAAAVLAGARALPDAADGRQPASLLFKLGGVDFGPLLDHFGRHPRDLRAGSLVGSAADEHVNLWGFGALLAAGHAEGLLSLRRAELHLAGWPRRREAVVNVTRVPGGAPDEDWKGAAHPRLARQVLEFAHWFRLRVPGCRDAYVAAVADRVGVRESRRIAGDHVLTGEEVRAGARFPDAVALGAFPIDVHAAHSPTLSHTEPPSRAYQIPYRCLVAAGPGNLLLGGRVVSSTHEANGSVRITATCFATGEAAGVAAALAAAGGGAVRDVDVHRLRGTLRRRGVLLDEADRTAPP
jgi:hypothetical protein